jgi:hypothetical protein
VTQRATLSFLRMVALQHRKGATIPNHRPTQEQNLKSRAKNNRALNKDPHLRSSPRQGEGKTPQAQYPVDALCISRDNGAREITGCRGHPCLTTVVI